MNNKKKNGFTLIELLITISLMLSLLGIAIVSFISISNRKKEQAYNMVKKQIITAAEQYFTSNEYLFEGLADGASGTISLGKLVSEDYLNVVTDPRTGKKLNKCSYVEVTKKGRKFSSKFIDNKEVCDSNNSLVLSEPGAPTAKLEITQTGNKGNFDKNYKDTGWYYDSFYIKLITNNNGNGKITEVVKAEADGTLCSTAYDTEHNLVGKENKTNITTPTATRTIQYKVTNVSGKSSIACKTYNMDNEAPTVTVSGSDETSWKKGPVTLTYNITDNLSGIKNSTRKWNDGSGSTYDYEEKRQHSNAKSARLTPDVIGEGRRKQEVEACDAAGNCSGFVEGFANIDNTAPYLDITGLQNRNKSDTTISKYTNYSESTLMNDLMLTLLRYYSDNWTNKEVLMYAITRDFTSGLNKDNTYCTDPRYNPSDKNYKFSLYRRIYGKTEGTFKFVCYAEDKAGNKSQGSFTIKRDITDPIVTVSGSMSNWSRESSHRLTFSMSDNLSGLSEYSRTVNDNIVDNNKPISGTSYTTTQDVSARGETKQEVKACDNVGNCASTTGVVKLMSTPNMTCQPYGSWSNTTANIKFDFDSLQDYTPGYVYFKRYNNNQDTFEKYVDIIKNGNEYRFSNSQYPYYTYDMYVTSTPNEISTNNRICYSKYDRLKPYTHAFYGMQISNGNGTITSNTCTYKKTTDQLSCSVTVRCPYNRTCELEGIGVTEDQNSTDEHGVSGFDHTILLHHYQNGSSCEEQEYSSKCDTGGGSHETSMDVWNIDVAGNQSSKSTINYNWIFN